MLNFQNIYVEKKALNHERTKNILKHFEPANIIEIDHYKDVFCRPKQNYILQQKYQNLILAIKEEDFIYPGASVCQDFGYENFHYASCVMNCACNCEYCYLKGMYPSGYMVVFVNLEDYFEHIKDKKLYLCVSYDTDLFPLEKFLSYVKLWNEFAGQNPKITIEIRTKFKNIEVWKMYPHNNVIFAFSLSPESIINNFEHNTSSLDARIQNIKAAQSNGFKTRLCFDPIIYIKNWRKEYLQMINKCFSEIDSEKVLDISVGSFRISQSYLKNMRRLNSTSKIINFPFKNINGYYQYEPKLQNEMEQFVYKNICKNFDSKKVFLWK